MALIVEPGMPILVSETCILHKKQLLYFAETRPL
jgi:hypothetical protein